MKCPSCGAQIAPSENVCPYCGTGIDRPAPEQHIHFHMENAQPDANRKPYGQQNYAAPPKAPTKAQRRYDAPYPRMTSSKSRLTMLILLIVLGYTGAHWFYAGRVGKGVICLCTCCFCGIGWLIDLATVLLGTPRDEQGLPIVW